MKIGKRLLAFLLALVLTCSCLGVAVFAAEDEEATKQVEETTAAETEGVAETEEAPTEETKAEEDDDLLRSTFDVYVRGLTADQVPASAYIQYRLTGGVNETQKRYLREVEPVEESGSLKYTFEVTAPKGAETRMAANSVNAYDYNTIIGYYGSVFMRVTSQTNPIGNPNYGGSLGTLVTLQYTGFSGTVTVTYEDYDTKAGTELMESWTSDPIPANQAYDVSKQMPESLDYNGHHYVLWPTRTGKPIGTMANKDISIRASYVLDENQNDIPDRCEVTVIYKVVNGGWDDGTTESITEYITVYKKNESTGNWTSTTVNDIEAPAVGNNPDKYYGAGSWDTEPSTSYKGSQAKQTFEYTYTYEKLADITVTVDGEEKTVPGGTQLSDLDKPSKDGSTFTGWTVNGKEVDDEYVLQPGDAIVSNWTVNPGSVSTEVWHGDNVPSFAAKAEDREEFLNDVLTEDDWAQMANGADIDIYLTIQDADNSVSEAEKQMVAAATDAIPGDYEVAKYLDIGLLKVIDKNTDDPIFINQTQKPLRLTVDVPEELLADGRVFVVVRVHNGVAEVLEDLVPGDGAHITFETDRFSTYAIAYRIEKDPDEPSKPTETTAPANPDVPKTGDEANLALWITMMTVSAAGAAMLVLADYKKRRMN